MNTFIVLGVITSLLMLALALYITAQVTSTTKPLFRAVLFFPDPWCSGTPGHGTGPIGDEMTAARGRTEICLLEPFFHVEG